MIPFIWHSWKDSIIVIGTVFYFGCDVYSTYISSGYGIQFSKLPEIHTKKGEILLYVQFSSGAQSCLTLSNPINCRTSGLPVHHQLPEFTQLHVHCQWCHPAISSSVDPFSSCPQSLPASGSFPMSQLFAWGGQSAWLCIVAIFHIYEIVHLWHSVIIQYLFRWLICMGAFSFWNLCLCETVRMET